MCVERNKNIAHLRWEMHQPNQPSRTEPNQTESTNKHSKAKYNQKGAAAAPVTTESTYEKTKKHEKRDEHSTAKWRTDYEKIVVLVTWFAPHPQWICIYARDWGTQVNVHILFTCITQLCKMYQEYYSFSHLFNFDLFLWYACVCVCVCAVLPVLLPSLC